VKKNWQLTEFEDATLAFSAAVMPRRSKRTPFVAITLLKRFVPGQKNYGDVEYG
jgi:hypothetical protein